MKFKLADLPATLQKIPLPAEVKFIRTLIAKLLANPRVPCLVHRDTNSIALSFKDRGPDSTKFPITQIWTGLADQLRPLSSQPDAPTFSHRSLYNGDSEAIAGSLNSGEMFSVDLTPEDKIIFVLHWSITQKNIEFAITVTARGPQASSYCSVIIDPHSLN